MVYDGAIRKRLYDLFKNKESAIAFFRRNREKLRNDKKETEEVFGPLIKRLQGPPDLSLKSSDILGMIEIFVIKNLEMMSDLMDILEISLLHQIETRDKILDIIGKSGDEQKRQISKMNNEITEIGKHKENLEWLDKYFRQFSKTSTE